MRARATRSASERIFYVAAIGRADAPVVTGFGQGLRRDVKPAKVGGSLQDGRRIADDVIVVNHVADMR